MAKFHGKLGDIRWDYQKSGTGTSVTQLLSWTLNATAEVADKTKMGDTWKSYLAGFKDWTATVECVAVDSGPIIPHDAGAAHALGEDIPLAADAQPYKARLVMYFVYDTVTTTYRAIWGDAVCTGVSHTVDANDVGKLTYTFQGRSALTVYSSDATAYTAPA